MQREEVAAWLQLLQASGVGGDTARRLLAAFGLPQQVLAQSTASLRQVVSARQAAALQACSPETEALIEATWQWLQQSTAGMQRRLLVLGSPDYPQSLLNMADPPVLLYAMGQVERWLAQEQPCIAVVGSRNPTPQGQSNAHQFCKGLAAAGWVVVSGMALGVDSAAHEGAVQAVAGDASTAKSKAVNAAKAAIAANTPADIATGIATIAVVGTGLDRVYPKQNRDLAHRIAQHGVLLSEQPLGTPPLPHHFPQRNRIIAGLSHGVLVVEAALQSGSLITARLAIEQGREVFAIPGSIHAPQVRGCHALIKQGAKLVESMHDIEQELEHVLPASRSRAGQVAAALSAEHFQAATATATSTFAALGAKDAQASRADVDATVNADENIASGSVAQDDNQVLLQALGHDPVSLDLLLERTALDTAALQAALLMLELQGLVGRLPGGLFQRIGRA